MKKDAIVFIESSSTGAGEVTARYANEINLVTILISKDPSMYPDDILKHIKYPIKCNTNNLNIIVDVIKNIKDFHVKGITTTNDFFVPHASYCANYFDLPSMKYKNAREVRNKYKMRVAIEKMNASFNPKFKLVNSQAEAMTVAQSFKYPLIFKPQDLNDSIDVELIHNEEDVKKYLEKSKKWDLNEFNAPISKEILVEEFIEGEEYSIETYQFINQPIQLIGINKKFMIGEDYNSFVELGVSFPHDNLNSFIFPKIAKMLSDIGVNCGVIHTEFKITKNKTIKILEINPRLIGDMAGSHLLEVALGDNPAHLVVDIAINNRKEFKPKYRKSSVLYGILMDKTGVFYGIANVNEILKNGAIILGAIKPINRKYLFPPKSNIDIVARIISSGNTIEEATSKAKKAISVTKFKYS